MHEGNPSSNTFPFTIEKEEPRNPCKPSPCGPYSICQVLNGRAVCSCQPNYYGQPPNCRVQCMINSDCAGDRSCVRNRCVDPCFNSPCGRNAICRVVNHSPICSCEPGYIGDPFSQCRLERKINAC